MIPYTAIRLEWLLEGRKQSAAVYDVSVYSLTFRTPQKLQDIDQAAIVMLDQRLTISDYTLSKAIAYPFYYEYKLTIDDENYRHQLVTFMKQMDDYIHYKNEDRQERSSAYPLEKDTDLYASYDQMLEEMMTSLIPDASYDAWFMKQPLAITLSDPHHYDMFLNNDWNKMKDLYFKEYHLDHHIVSRHPIEALYIGNAYCFLLFPEIRQLSLMIDKAHALNMESVIVLPPLKQRFISAYEEILTIAEKENCEIIVNDYGLLTHVRKKGLKYSLGILMNKYLKDPRLIYKRGNKAYLHETGLSRSNDLLRQSDIIAVSTETLALTYPHDVYFPLYLTNMSSFCTMYAACHNGGRGAQEDVVSCPHDCLHQHFLYPKHLHMIGKYNALFAYDLDLLSKPKKDSYLRRLVFTC